jgi:hypothetical protein
MRMIPATGILIWILPDCRLEWTMPLVYQSGEEVMSGDRVRCKDDEGKIIALEDQLAEWGLASDEAKGHVMIEFKMMGLVCQTTETNEDLVFLGRGQP